MPSMGDYLLSRFGEAVVTDATPSPSPMTPELLTNPTQEATQFADWSQYQQGLRGEQAANGEIASAATYLLHPDQLAEASNELDRRELEAQASDSMWTEESFNQIVELARKYPKLDPGVLEAMALGGISDASEDGQYILQQAAEKKFIDDQGGMPVGMEMTPEKVVSARTPKEKEEAGNPVMNAIRGTVRTALAVPIGAAEAFSAGLTAVGQEALGGPDAGETLDQLGDEGGGGTLAELVRGATRSDEDVQLGAGWLPQQGGEVLADEQGNVGEGNTSMSAGEAAGKRLIQHEGRFLSPGRIIPEMLNATSQDWAGVNVIEPGAKAYNALSWTVDTALQLSSANPGNLIADAPAAFRASKKAFAPNNATALREMGMELLEGAGGIKAMRRTVDTDRAAQWLDSRAGGKLADHIAKTTSVTELMKRPGLDPRTAGLLSEAKNSVEVKSILKPLMGTHIKAAPPSPGMLGSAAAWVGRGGTVQKLRNSAGRTMRKLGPHLGGGSAGMLENPGDLNAVYVQMQAHMANARFSPDEIETVNKAITQLPDDDPMAVNRLVGELFDPVAKRKVKEYATDFTNEDKLAMMVTRRFRQRADDERMYWVDELGKPRRVAGAQTKVLVNGEQVALPSPAIPAEFLNGAIPMPDAKEMRRATAMPGVNALLNSKLTGEYARWADDAVSRLTSNVWKPAMLLRAAYITRVGAAEQLRLAATGHDSMFSNPASVLAYMTGRKGDAALDDGTKLLEDSNHFRSAMNRLSTDTKAGRAGWMADGNFKAVSLDMDEDAYFTGLANELQMLSEDPTVKHLLANGKDATKQWLWDGDGRVHREALMTTESKRMAMSRRGTDPEDAGYVDSLDGHVDTLDDIVQNITSGDADLLTAIRDGVMGDVRIPDKAWSQGERQTLRKLLEGKAANGIGPQYVRGMADKQAAESTGRKVLDGVMDLILTRPTNYASRSPLFKQRYWDNAMRLAGDLDDEALFKLKDMARQANMGDDYIARLDKLKGGPVGGTAIGDFDALDLLAKTRAVDEVKELLYDPTIRGNAATLTRNLFPFAEAWAEEFKVWGRVLKDNPLKPGVRGSQAWDFLRESNPFDLDDPSEGRGVFYTNQYDEEVFAVPLGVLAPLGVPEGSTMEMSASGLSMMDFSTFLPGLGPVAQVPASTIINSIPDRFYWLRDSVMDIAMPYGEFSEGSLGGAVDRSMPAWLRRAVDVMTANPDTPDEHRQFADATSRTMKGMLATGEVATPTNQTEAQELIRQAAKATRGLWMIEAAGKFLLPSSPRAASEMKDEAGNVYDVAVLSDYYYEMVDQVGQEAAAAQLIRDFGTEGLSSLMLPRSRATRPVDVTEEGFNWKREHREFYDAHRDAAYHFSGTDEDSPFSFDAYDEAMQEGSFLRLPLAEQLVQMSDRVGGIMYDAAKRNAEKIYGSTDSDEARLWLRSQRIGIQRSLYGYSTGRGFDGMEPEAELAAVAGALDAAPKGSLRDAIEDLIVEHDEANLLAAESGLANYYQAKAAAPIRDGIRARIENIVAITPEADSVAELMRKLMDDAPVAEEGLMQWGGMDSDGFGEMPPATVGPVPGVTEAMAGPGVLEVPGGSSQAPLTL